MQEVQVQEQVKVKPVSRTQRSVRAIRQQLQAFSFTVPALVLLAIFLLYPIGYVIYLSFQRWNLLGTPQFIGLQNYATIFFRDSAFLQSVGVTIFFVILAVPAQVALGLLLAILIENEFRGRTFFRTVFFIPLVVSFVAAGITFQWMFSTTANPGIFPAILTSLGLKFPDWQTSNGIMAMVMVVIMNTWKATGFSMILYLAGLQSISPELYEAASIDGVGNAWQRFRYVSWPLLIPTTTLLIITNTIGSFQAFEPFYVMTNGGPAGATTTIVFYIYNNFATRTGVASAAATIFLIFVLAITVVQLVVSQRTQRGYY
ncbi:MAG TPA: sugar ABC transporter permease [Ktedonobacteraceae bacterium]|nr:sugar ABC transporter permease [Ktedonobacteraceae bacterium]